MVLLTTARLALLPACGLEARRSPGARRHGYRVVLAEMSRQLRRPYIGGCSSPVNQPIASDFIGSSDGMAICST